MSLSEQLEQRLTLHTRAALQRVGDAWAAAANQAVPVRTGILQRSIRFDVETDTHGALVMRTYGIYVQRGHRLARRPSTHVAPNAFLTRAWASEGVRTALAELPDLLFQHGE